MDRRLFLLLLVAGCADTSTEFKPVTGSPFPAPEPPPPRPQLPSAQPGPTSSGDASFDEWRGQFRNRALAAGLAPALLDRELAGLAPNPRVISLDSAQPEFSKPVGDYIKGTVSDDRIARGQRYRADLPFWGGIEQRFGVPRDILIAVWAMESGFGAIQGDFDVIRCMASLAFHGRRRAFAEGELIAALRIIESGEADRGRLKGSWAGAMGQTQFLPSNYLATAVDGDGDGRRDIWGSSNDALASAANLLAKGGWTRGEGWAREVIAPPGFDYSLTEGPRETPDWWAGLGLRPADGRGWSGADAAAKAMLAAPAGAGGPIFLLFPNHFAIRKYNNSTAYALGIGLLADRFAGAGPLVRAWPIEIPLGIGDRIAAQTALARLGFDPGAPDGVVGVNTRTALRAWQKARGITADGYLSMDMVRRLNVEVGALPPAG
ncbi:lytic murein transglycosylase [Phenylobacterium sp. LH3H17]|uniref:lytic murein transglycosylase n=1 Tax=Phenylobacterium sp. LH3H17 TaxID=2903901 RepID=UPI0020C9C9F8|nr:lytic murein transglycosylase [Phenylobacterium sp. LH3H17]UTP40142.1 lytic murein transglycosylase [Phenylobacterium sp. LH3H17]